MKYTIKRIARTLISELLYNFNPTKPRKILFHHMPKCGGSTLTSYITAQYPYRKVFSINGPNRGESINKFKTFPKEKRYEYDLIQGHSAHKLLEYINPDCLKIIILRDPIERIVSHYYYVLRNSEHYLHSKVIKLGIELENYVSYDLSDELQNYYTTCFTGLSPVDAEEKPVLSVSKAAEFVMKNYDLIGFLDEFSYFTELLYKQARFKFKYNGRRFNVTQNRPALKDIPESTLKKIEKANSLDIELYKILLESFKKYPLN